MRQAAGGGIQDFEFRELSDEEAQKWKEERAAIRAPHGRPANRIRQRVQHLCGLVYKRDKTLPVIHRGEAAWLEWRDWRAKYGISNSYFEKAESFTVPTEFPPIDIDQAIRNFGSGKLADKLEE